MRALALACVLASGCVTWRGPFAPGLDAPRGEAAVSIVLLGEAGLTGRRAHATADAVTQVLGRGDAVALLLGDHRAHRLDARGRPRPDEGEAPVMRAVASVPSVAIAGAAEAGTKAPGIGTVAVRIGKTGTPRVISRCEARTCELVPEDDMHDDRLELVVLDIGAWRRAKLGDDDALARIEALLDALARTPAKVPRVLVTYLPIEGGFEHGLGALAGPSATFHNLPARVQEAIASGMFVGTIAGGEHAIHATHDVGRAVQRTDKTWLAQPVWQVVSGNASSPAGGHGTAWRKTKLARGVGFQPELATDRMGFAVIELGEAEATLDVYARRNRKWWRARTALALHPLAHRGARRAPRMPPCMRCDEVPSSDRR
ncbi:MAG TPA: hypothetical protein VG755_21885 [Nannocystaceae bacterium]|nr:hypothetical protein [Nannocystaceae bacterium]